MFGLTAALILHASTLVAADNDTTVSYASYAEARQKTVESGSPLVVLVGADWCPHCVKMQQEVIPQIRRKGLLRKVLFAVVDLDRERTLGQQLTGGGPVPQLLMFRRTTDGWKKRRLVGGQSVGTVGRFIDQGLKLDEQAKQSEQTPVSTASQARASAPKPH